MWSCRCEGGPPGRFATTVVTSRCAAIGAPGAERQAGRLRMDGGRRPENSGFSRKTAGPWWWVTAARSVEGLLPASQRSRCRSLTSASVKSIRTATPERRPPQPRATPPWSLPPVRLGETPCRSGHPLAAVQHLPRPARVRSSSSHLLRLWKSRVRPLRPGIRRSTSAPTSHIARPSQRTEPSGHG